MLSENIEKINSPIIYIAISLYLSCIYFSMENSFKWLAVIFASFFFIYIAFTTNKIFTFVIFLFFIFGYIFCYGFYDSNLKEDFNGDIRIVEERNYYSIGEIQGNRVIIKGKLKGSLGKRFNVVGEFTEEINIEGGTVGTLKVSEYKELPLDYLGRIYSFREDIYNKLKDNLGQRKASLVSSLSFGYSNYLDGEDRQEFKNFGVVHAISVSGLHVSLVFLILSFFLGKRWGIIITSLYVVFTGIPFSSLRALIMLICSFSAFSLRKNYNSLGGLALSSIIIFLIKPYSIFQLGFLLSFSSTLGIILFSRKILSVVYRLPKYCRETIAISLASQVFSLYILIFYFNEFSIFFLVGNLLIVPFLNVIIALGNLSLVFYFLPKVFDFICFLLLKVIDIVDWIVEALYLFNFQSLTVNRAVGYFYVFLLIAMYFIYKGHKKMIILPLSYLLIFLVLLYSPILRVEYLREGGLLLSYKGERIIITNRRDIDAYKLKKVNLCNNLILEGENEKLFNSITLNSHGKNFIFNSEGQEYYLKIYNRGIVDENYDIINFIDDGYKGFYLLNNEVYLFK